ncbi:MAG: DUF86 domain-containing protein [Clostridiales bacterium]|nr:DUF86 domain-containing protein [Clostridiales bacterium]
MQHRDRVVLEKIVQEINISDEMIGNVDLKEFLADEKLKRAVSMTIINIGEMIKLISDDLRAKYPEVPWKDAAGMRDITAHKYQTLRMEDVFSSATSDFPALKKQIQSILEKED